MSRNLSPNPVIPAHVADGLLAVVASRPELAGGQWLLSLRLPLGADGEGAPLGGRYFLARCGAVEEWERDQLWSLYLRRPLFGLRKRVVDAGQEEIWTVALADISARGATASVEDAHTTWLLTRQPGQAIHLLPALGKGFTLAATTRNLLVMADSRRAALLLPLMDAALDRGGRVTLLLRQDARAEHTFPVTRLPLAVEVHLSGDDAEWFGHLAETLRWADQMALALPLDRLPRVGAEIRDRRFHLTESFAQVLVETPLLCGVGACLACVVPLPHGGFTRSCVHGPVLDLTALS